MTPAEQFSACLHTAQQLVARYRAAAHGDPCNSALTTAMIAGVLALV